MNDPYLTESAIEKAIESIPGVFTALSGLGPWGMAIAGVISAVLIGGGAYLTWRARKRRNEKAALESAFNRQENINETESQGRALDRDFSDSHDAADREIEEWNRE